MNLRAGGKAVRDTRHGVKIAISAGDFQVLSLTKLVELKLASGMTAPHRLQDLADVQRLIGIRKLPRELAEELDPYVRSKFDELWTSAQHEPDDY